jgi:hypothetical protein
MEEESIRSSVLRMLYEAFFHADAPVDLDKLREEMRLDETAFWGVVDSLEADSLIKIRAAGRSYRVAARGVLAAEESGLVSEVLVQQNRHIRAVILDELVWVYDENRWFADSNVEVLAKNTGLNVYAVVFNLKILNDLGYVKPTASGSYAPTEFGEEAVKEWRQRTELLAELDRIKALRPQQRGREFQKLFAKVVELDGWSPAEGVRTSHEEIDVIAHKNRDYFLVECKWERKPIEGSVVRELFGKLGNRTDIRGVLVSMSGFTSGAAKQVQDFANINLILLFGQEDVNTLITGKSSFDDLVDEKIHQLITRRVVAYK